MPWPVYSETFIRMTAQGVWSRYTVPAGHRVVVKQVNVCAFAQAGAAAYVEVQGVYLINAVNLAAYASVSLPCMAVVYAGQIVSAFSQTQACHISVSGYLFRETTLLRRGPPEVEEAPVVGEPPATADTPLELAAS